MTQNVLTIIIVVLGIYMFEGCSSCFSEERQELKVHYVSVTAAIRSPFTKISDFMEKSIAVIKSSTLITQEEFLAFQKISHPFSKDSIRYSDIRMILVSDTNIVVYNLLDIIDNSTEQTTPKKIFLKNLIDNGKLPNNIIENIKTRIQTYKNNK